MIRRWFLIFLVLGGWFASGCGMKADRAAPGFQKKRELSSSVYAWQRLWTPAVANAVREAGKDFPMICYLAGEREAAAASAGTSGKADTWHWVKPDWAALRESGASIAAAIRIRVPKGRLEQEAVALQNAAAEIAGEASANGVSIVEWHLDLDCPGSRLGEYAALMKILRDGSRAGSGAADSTASASWVITALPDWLEAFGFDELARAAGLFVLQVHALKLPAPGQAEGQLCDVAQARQWVEKAGKYGVPFRVALPTYASRVFFDAAGKVLDVAGEDGAEHGPAGTASVCLMRSDAAALAQLVSQWQAAPPEGCMGLIWYRLPVAGDQWNWSGSALREVMQGRVPESRIGWEVVLNKGGFYELTARGTGGVEARLPTEVAIAAPEGTGILAWDFHGNWRGQLKNGKLLSTCPGGWLFPAQVERLGWVRLNRPGKPILTVLP